MRAGTQFGVGLDQRGSVATVLSLGFRIMQCRIYTFNDAHREYGMSLRTYRRYLAKLRTAGMILHSPMGGCQSMGTVHYIGFDQMFHDRARASFRKRQDASSAA